VLKIFDVKQNHDDLELLVSKFPSQFNDFILYDKCEFIVIEEINEKIVGVSCIGGFLNVIGIMILEDFRGKGIGKKLLTKNIEEAKRRGYSYVFATRRFNNTSIKKILDQNGFEHIFTISYSKEITSEAAILVINKRGLFIKKLLSFFNTRFGIFVLSILLKFSRKKLFSSLLAYNPNRYPPPDFHNTMNKFRKTEH